MQMDPEALYMQLGLLAATMPDLSGDPKPTDIQWLAKLDALLDASGNIANIAELRTMVISLNNSHSFDRFRHAQQIAFILHRALAAAELKAPASLSGSFIPVGNVFEAMAAVGKVLQAAKQDVLIVDPYMDETVLTDFGTVISTGVSLRLLADGASVKPSLTPASKM